MSYGVIPEATPAPRQRPSTVTVAGMLLYGIAGLTVISAIVSVATFSKTMDAAKEAYANISNGDTVITFARIGGIIGIIFSLLIAALFVVLAAGNLRGKNGLRITTWVIAGLGVICYGCGVASGGLQTRFTSGGSTGDANAQQLRDAAQKMQDSIPAWTHAWSVTAAVLGLIASATVIILLALPSSNQFFRKPEPEFTPYPLYPPAA
jgi:preprotein translocase subunit YajC